MATIGDRAFVTLATDDTYSLGALVLGHSLRQVGTNAHLVVLITPGVSQPMRSLLESLYDLVKEVDLIQSKDTVNLDLLARPELGVTFTKLHCWSLTQYQKCVFLDADTLVLKNCDELFEREELSAVPDVGWPDCFNSGVFVFKPSKETFEELLRFGLTKGSFDGGDQGLLNLYFGDWATKDIARHLSFIYNMNSNVSYTYLPAFKHFGKDVKIVHFLGSLKPWMQGYNVATGQAEPRGDCMHAQEHLQMWWDIFMQKVQPRLQPGCVGLAADLAKLSLESPSSSSPSSSTAPSHEAFLGDYARQYAWERGQIDYMGRDSFENIQKKLDEAIEK